MSKVKQYIEQATHERIRSRGLIRKIAIEAARMQRDETRRQAMFFAMKRVSSCLVPAKIKLLMMC